MLVVRYPGHAVAASEFTNEALNSGAALFEYGTEAFTKLACARPVYLQTILDLGFSAVWSDTDTVWLQNLLSVAPRVREPFPVHPQRPLPFPCVVQRQLSSYLVVHCAHDRLPRLVSPLPQMSLTTALVVMRCLQHEAKALRLLRHACTQDLDYVGVDDSEQPEQETENACTGLMYLNPTDKAKALMRAWHDTCQEQRFLNQPAWNTEVVGTCQGALCQASSAR